MAIITGIIYENLHKIYNLIEKTVGYRDALRDRLKRNLSQESEDLDKANEYEQVMDCGLGETEAKRDELYKMAENLIEDISQFLGYDNTTDAILVGAGKLGQALLGYSGFAAYGLNILAAFDARPTTAAIDGKDIFSMDKLEGFCRSRKVLMAIITVPAEYAQEICDKLIACGIKGIWNFAPIHLDVPANILVQNENMATSLAVLSMHLQAQIKEKK